MMKLIFADPTLRRTVDSSTAWYQYLIPELQVYWAVPVVFGHQEYSQAMEKPLVLSEYGQSVPTALPITGLFPSDGRTFLKQETASESFAQFTALAAEAHSAFREMVEIGPQDCIYVREASLPYAHGAISWLEQFAHAARPKMIIQLSASGLEDIIAGAEDPSLIHQPAAQIRNILASGIQTHLKLVATDAWTASYFETLFQSPVERWPDPQIFSKKSTDNRGVAKGRLVAFLGNQSSEKGAGLIPELASLLLKQHPNAALLVHDGLNENALGLAAFLQGLESSQKRLIFMPGAVPFDRWKQILSSIDLAILPYDPHVFRHRQSFLLDELIANGVPSIVPRHTALSTRLETFGLSGQSFETYTADSICAAAGDALSRYDEVLGKARSAREQWAQVEGAHHLALKILCWFPETKPYWKGWSGIAQGPNTESNKNRSKRILLSWSVDSAYIPFPQLSNNQITVGPHPLATAKNWLLPNRRRSFDAYTPFFHTYDLKKTLELQGITGPFDLVVVFTESAFGNLPVNVGAFDCPSVFYAGDTHWGHAVIKRMMDYAVGGKFDYLMTTYNRQHLHWYKQVGIKQLAWIPALAAEHHPQPFRAQKENRIAFSGQTTQGLHARRARLIESLKENGLPVYAQSSTRSEAAALYNSSLMSFNASMNGDLNLRVFEVMSAGGCLLTDRLAPEAGQELLFEEGRDYLGYSSEQELLEVARCCLADPEKALRMARNGNAIYNGKFSPGQQTGAFLDWIFSGELKPEYGSDWDVRTQLAAAHPLSLPTRMAIYQELQDAHRVEETVRVLVGPGVPACVVGDMIDLPRIACTVLEGEQTLRPILRRFGLADRVRYLDSRKHAKTSDTWNYLITTGEAAPLEAIIPHKQLLHIDGLQNLQKKAGSKVHNLLQA